MAAYSHVLVVEDDVDIRETIKEVLELEGFRVSVATNGREALLRLEQLAPPCLILLDLMMPVMNGWEFLEAVRCREDVLATIPITVVSAAADAAQAIRYDCNFIKKPPDLDQLLAVAHAHCHSIP